MASPPGPLPGSPMGSLSADGVLHVTKLDTLGQKSPGGSKEKKLLGFSDEHERILTLMLETGNQDLSKLSSHGCKL